MTLHNMLDIKSNGILLPLNSYIRSAKYLQIPS